MADDNQQYWLSLFPPNRGPAPVESLVPTGPRFNRVPARQRLFGLTEISSSNPHDEDLFDYYATSHWHL